METPGIFGNKPSSRCACATLDTLTNTEGNGQTRTKVEKDALGGRSRLELLDCPLYVPCIVCPDSLQGQTERAARRVPENTVTFRKGATSLHQFRPLQNQHACTPSCQSSLPEEGKHTHLAPVLQRRVRHLAKVLNCSADDFTLEIDLKNEKRSQRRIKDETMRLWAQRGGLLVLMIGHVRAVRGEFGISDLCAVSGTGMQQRVGLGFVPSLTRLTRRQPQGRRLGAAATLASGQHNDGDDVKLRHAAAPVVFAAHDMARFQEEYRTRGWVEIADFVPGSIPSQRPMKMNEHADEHTPSLARPLMQ